MHNEEQVRLANTPACVPACKDFHRAPLKQWQRVNRLTAEKKLVAVEDVETAVDPSPGSLYVGYPPGLCSHIATKLRYSVMHETLCLA
ncbi:hypothetical protein Y1Q_0023465 [Alligator mississippiensis]|uniref:Uncharacterized protein n=1 Tax=Alligator mississippiensis TaxID=8496 RepID=A0A151NPT6_ALLMI|nr:hypothetical protein Y1Q_0023465 [Alligator mississippiensis]